MPSGIPQVAENGFGFSCWGFRLPRVNSIFPQPLKRCPDTDRVFIISLPGDKIWLQLGDELSWDKTIRADSSREQAGVQCLRPWDWKCELPDRYRLSQGPYLSQGRNGQQALLAGGHAE
jgi:hypothetical protein